jgi:hypothetical protein
MANYNIKQEAKVYLVVSGTKYKLEVGPDLSFSQTFTDKPKAVKTLHAQNDFFDRSTIKKANPANFKFSVFFYEDNTSYNTTAIVHDKLISCGVFDLYISTELDRFYLKDCVIANGTYGIERSKPLSLTVSGTASKLSRVTSTITSDALIPGSSASVNSNRKILMNEQVLVQLGGNNLDISTEIVAIKAELQNSIRWTENATIDDAINVIGASTAIFPKKFTVSKKSLAGNITRYLCDTNNQQLYQFNESISLRIRVGEVINGSFHGVDIDMPTSSFTNRSAVSDVFLQNYEWRNTSNQALSTTITYNK